MEVFNETTTVLNRFCYYGSITIIWLINSIVNLKLNFSHTHQSVIEVYTNYCMFVLLNEFLFQICYSPEMFDYIIILVTVIWWKCLNELQELKNYIVIPVIKITIIQFIVLFIVIIIIIHQAYWHSSKRHRILIIIGAEIFHICVLFVMTGINDTFPFYMRNWQIFYFNALCFPEKKYHVVYVILIGMTVCEIMNYGVQPPYELS